MFICGFLLFSCEPKEEIEVLPKEEIKLIFPTSDSALQICCPEVSWEYSKDNTLVQLFSDDSYEPSAIIQADLVELERTYQIPVDLLPSTNYWLRLSNGEQELKTSIRVDDLDLEGFLGDHQVNVVKRENDPADNIEFVGTLKIESIDPWTIRLSEEESGLNEELPYLEVIQDISIWFKKTNPDVNIRLVKNGNKVEARYYLEVIGSTPFWSYDSI